MPARFIVLDRGGKQSGFVSEIYLVTGSRKRVWSSEEEAQG
jgi:hypothetical protein